MNDSSNVEYVLNLKDIELSSVTPGDTMTIDLTIRGKRPKYPIVESPEAMLKNPEGSWYKKLMALTSGLSPLKTAVVHPVDTLSLQGAINAATEKLIIPILIGPKDKIIAAALEAGIDISPYQIMPTRHSHESADMAVQLAREHKVEAIMKGKIHTDELMKPVINKENGLLTGRRMSHVFYVEAPKYFKPLFISDAALNIRPNLQEKKDITQNAIDLFRTLGFGTPKVAIVCAVETVNEKMPSTLDAAALSKMAERGDITGAIVDGPLAFDNAISLESARDKNITSPVAGCADIIIVPDIESGNMLYKEMSFRSGMEAAGMVIGASVPIMLTSRGSDDISRKASCAMTLIYVRNKERRHD